MDCWIVVKSLVKTEVKIGEAFGKGGDSLNIFGGWEFILCDFEVVEIGHSFNFICRDISDEIAR